MNLIEAIINGKMNIELFDRPASEDYTPELIDSLICIIPKADDDFTKFCRQVEYAREWHNSKILRPILKSGNPIDLIIEKAQNEDILKKLQYLYYYYLSSSENRADFSIDIIVISCIMINIDMAFETITSKENIYELVINPLKHGEDIRSMFPFGFKNMKDVFNQRELMKLHARLIASQKNTLRRHNILKIIKKNGK